VSELRDIVDCCFTELAQ